MSSMIPKNPSVTRQWHLNPKDHGLGQRTPKISLRSLSMKFAFAMAVIVMMDTQPTFAAESLAKSKDEKLKDGVGGVSGCGGSKSLRLLDEQLGVQGQDGYSNVGSDKNSEKLAHLEDPAIKDSWAKNIMMDMMDWASRGGTELEEDENVSPITPFHVAQISSVIHYTASSQ